MRAEAPGFREPVDFSCQAPPNPTLIDCKTQIPHRMGERHSCCSAPHVLLGSRINTYVIGSVALVALFLTFFQAKVEIRSLADEVERSALALAEIQESAAEPLLQAGSPARLQALVDRFQNRGQSAGEAIYDVKGQPLAITAALAANVVFPPSAVVQAMRYGWRQSEFLPVGGKPMHVLALPLKSDRGVIGAIAIFQDAAGIASHDASVWRHALENLAVQTVLILIITIVVVRWSLIKPLRRMAQWLEDLRTGKTPVESELPKEALFRPLAKEVSRIATSLQAARAAADEEAHLRDTAQALWTPERLRIFVQTKLDGARLFAVSNREPYEHNVRGGSVVWSVPPSGLVTALEPVLQACDGTWVAQATGDADRASADVRGRVSVPPDHPQYTLRRVWLTKEEEDGFYFGFANEGLWPLCHIAHTRPIFRAEDWAAYQVVNQKFADALLDEIEGEHNPVVLVQDYHFALLPQMIKKRRPDARIAIFWHIPWPNPEAFGICPWQREMLDGMLSADLIGFHIQAHCNNFLETVDRALESRIDWESFAVNRRDHVTVVRPFPISVAFSAASADQAPATNPAAERSALFRQLGVEASLMGLGVDRIDYTKGIVERFRGIERFLDRFPNYRGQLTFVQIGAPSRTHIKRYQDLMLEVEAEAERINQRWRKGDWKPIVLLERQHSHEEIKPYYRAANFCLVTSLHDGMNLVAKEFVASRADRDGVLILSRFAGASQQLLDALMVNPYDTEELAQAIHTALEMPPEDRSARMRRMREQLRENNVYRWAGDLIGELTGIRLGIVKPSAPLASAPPRELAEMAVAGPMVERMRHRG
jgi:alpha,alpha-trehalose-phosphate synthase [UDP-forming]